MDSTVSDKSDMARAEIGSLFGAMLLKRSSDVGVFGDNYARVEADESSRRTLTTLQMAQRIYSLSDDVGNSTNGWKAIQDCIDNERVYDRIIVFTDEQLWDSTLQRLDGSSGQTLKSVWDEYTETVNPDAHLYVIDLASYGDLTMPENYHNVHQISGWSSNVIEFIEANETADDVVREIEMITPGAY